MNRAIVIQGALQSEIDLFLKVFNVVKKVDVGSFVFYECVYKNQPIIVSKTKMGEIASAIATTLCVEKYNPLFIINQGTAGACVDWLSTNDIVVGTKIYYISQFSTDENKEIEEINPWKNEGYKTIDNEFVSYKTDEKLISNLKSLNALSGKNIYFDVIGSGDVWTKDIEKMAEYNAKYGVVCEAMECSGAYLASNSLGVPMVSIRVISNNEIKNESYDPQTGVVAQEKVIQIIDEIIENKKFDFS